jgi:hypothetical protein
MTGMIRMLHPVLAVLLIAAAVPALAVQGAKASSPVELASKADALKPGEWVWAGEIAPAGPVLVNIDLSRQVASVYRNGVLIGVTTISSGKKSYETPTGVFTILQKKEKHFSNLYDDAPMPNMQRLTWGGVALHAGRLPGWPASHGCVRMPMEFSKLLFGTTQLGGTVIIAGHPGAPELVPPAGVLAPPVAGSVAAEPLPADAAWRWQPEKSLTGPVSIVVSRAEQRLIVLRGGKEIGRSDIRMAPQARTGGTSVYTLAPAPAGGLHWVRVELPGQDGVAAVLDPAAVAAAQVPAGFRAAITPLLVAGTTVLVTPEPITRSSTGKQITVLRSEEPK